MRKRYFSIGELREVAFYIKNKYKIERLPPLSSKAWSDFYKEMKKDERSN